MNAYRDIKNIHNIGAKALSWLIILIKSVILKTFHNRNFCLSGSLTLWAMNQLAWL